MYINKSTIDAYIDQLSYKLLDDDLDDLQRARIEAQLQFLEWILAIAQR